MTHIDDAIRQALSAEDAKLLDAFGAEQGLHNQLLQTFQGRLWWVNVFGWILGFALFAALCYCVWRFLGTPDLREMLIWGVAVGVAFTGLAMVKIWFFLEMQKNAIIREVKRLELQVARLSMRANR